MQLIQARRPQGRALHLAAWTRAGAIIARLVRNKDLSPQGIRRSFVNDCLIAASQRDHCFILITDNERDFELIRKVERVKTTPPWPKALLG